LIGGIVTLIVVLYSDSITTMVELWQYSSYAHSPIVLLISGFLLWRVRGPLAAEGMQPYAWGIPLLLALALAWVVARAVSVQALEHLAVALLIPAAVLTFLGSALASRAAFPLLFLLAAVPVGDTLIPSLMRITADVSAFFLRGAGVPVYREGQFMTLPGGVFEVAEVCAGLRYLISGSILALLFGYLTFTSVWKRVIFVACTAVCLVLANAVRAFIVMYVASASDMRFFAGRDHIYFGWLLFGLLVAGIFWVGARFADVDIDTGADDGANADADGGLVPGSEGRPAGARWPLLPFIISAGLITLAMTSSPLQQDLGNPLILLIPAAGLLLFVLLRYVSPASTNVSSAGTVVHRGLRAKSIGVICIAMGVLLSGPLLLAWTATEGVSSHPGIALPSTAVCGAPASWSPGWQPSFANASMDLSGTYSCAGAEVNVFVAPFTNRGQAGDMIVSGDRPFPETWRRDATQGFHVVGQSHGRPLEVNEVQMRQAGAERLLWYWYEVGGQFTAKPFIAKLLQAAQVIAGNDAQGSIYVLETMLEPSLLESRQRLTQLAPVTAGDVADFLQTSAEDVD
jgi:exosortase A